MTTRGIRASFRIALLGALAFRAASAFAISPEQRCEARKKLDAGRHAACLLKAEAKLATGGDAERYASTLARCDEKLAKSFARQEEVAGRRSASCPTNGDSAGLALDLDQVSRRLSASLAGRPRFDDNGDGTVTDHDADILWEQKVALDGVTNPNDLHDADNLYRWAGTCSLATDSRCQPDAASSAACFAGVEGDTTGCDICSAGEGVCIVDSPGVTVWQWLVALNDAAFAGYRDWRVPTRDEMNSLVDPLAHHPSIAPVFAGASCGSGCTDVRAAECACTLDDFHWTASTYAPNVLRAWKISFVGGIAITTAKSEDFLVARAVRSLP